MDKPSKRHPHRTEKQRGQGAAERTQPQRVHYNLWMHEIPYPCHPILHEKTYRRQWQRDEPDRRCGRRQEDTKRLLFRMVILQVQRTDASARTAVGTINRGMLCPHVLGLPQPEEGTRTARHTAGREMLRMDVLWMRETDADPTTARHHTGQGMLRRDVQRVHPTEGSLSTTRPGNGKRMLQRDVQKHRIDTSAAIARHATGGELLRGDV